MTEKIIEIYILEDGKFILFQTFIEMKEIMEDMPKDVNSNDPREFIDNIMDRIKPQIIKVPIKTNLI